MGFFNLSKANEKIAALEAELKQEKENATTAAKEFETQTTAKDQQISKLLVENADLTTKLATATAANADLTAKLADATAKLAEVPAKIEQQASAKALEITAGQGQPPVASTPSASTTADIVAQYNAIPANEPGRRTAFYRKHRAALAAARKQ